MFELAPLPYDYDALEQAIDAVTMELHYTKHHQAYVDKLNAALAVAPDLAARSSEPDLVELISDISTLPSNSQTAVRNHGGGHYNHQLFWASMSPQGGGEPAGELAQALNHHFGNFDNFRNKFEEAATGQFGSGWAWLIKDARGNLQLTSTPNQDNPLMKGIAEVVGTPLLGVDVWEHAYYLRYQNRRGDYLAAWWSVVDWAAVAKRWG